jgi:hypothetical protein
MKPCAHLPSDTSVPVQPLLTDHLAVRYSTVLAPDLCRGLTEQVLRARSAWVPAFDRAQFTLGRAYYTHLEEGLEEEYFAHAAESDRTVETALPGFQDLMQALLEKLVVEPVHRRAGWCGPGVHVFPAGQWLSEHGGDVHFDVEGLPAEDLSARTLALSVVLMLQAPSEGGELAVWDALYGGSMFPSEEQRTRPRDLIRYAPGDLVVFDSYRLHQIQPFFGGLDRISATAHLVRAKDSWLMWF